MRALGPGRYLCLLIVIRLKPFGDRRRRSFAVGLFSGSGWSFLGPENPWRSCGTSRRRLLGNFLRITSRLRHLGLRTFQVRHVGRALFSGPRRSFVGRTNSCRSRGRASRRRRPELRQGISRFRLGCLRLGRPKTEQPPQEAWSLLFLAHPSLMERMTVIGPNNDSTSALAL